MAAPAPSVRQATAGLPESAGKAFAQPPRTVGVPWRAAAILLITFGLVQTFPLLGLTSARGLTAQHLASVFDLLEGREFHFGADPADPISPLRNLLDKGQRFPLVDPKGNLDGFFRALQLAESGQRTEPIHVLHYGDSPTTADLITADVRTRLQGKFGNAGYGFNLVAPPWAWYQHRGIKLSAGGWKIQSPAMGSKGDGRYGLGGVSFEGNEGAYSTVTLQDSGHSRLRVYYLRRPDGGTFEVEASGAVIATVLTAGDGVVSGVADIAIPSGTREVTVRVSEGTARIFGMEFSKQRPGVLYSSLGLNGGYTSILTQFMEFSHWSQQLKAARPSLVVINYGTNESVFGEFVNKYLETELRRLIKRVQESVPESAILIMSPMDRGTKNEAGEIVTPKTIPNIVRIQEKVARETGVAFFNTYEAMGGAGTMAKWYERNPRLVGGDYIHPLPAGAKLVGDLLVEGLEEQYQRYKLREVKRALESDARQRRKRG